MKEDNLSSSTRPTNLSTPSPFFRPITVGTALTPCSMAMSARSSISTMARSTSSSAAAMAASSLEKYFELALSVRELN